MTIDKENHINGNGKQASLDKGVVFTRDETSEKVDNTLQTGEKIEIDENEINEVLKENVAHYRVTLLRHYPYIDVEILKECKKLLRKKINREELNEDENKRLSELEKLFNKEIFQQLSNNPDSILDTIFDDYNKLLSKKLNQLPITKEENESLGALEKIVDRLTYVSFEDIPDERIRNVISTTFNDSENTLLIYPKEGKQRVQSTGLDLSKRFNIENIEDILLTGSKKTDPLGNIYIDMCTMFKDAYVKILKNNENKSFENIVIIGNRTYSYGMNFLSGNGHITIRQSEIDFENEGYIYNDYHVSLKEFKIKDKDEYEEKLVSDLVSKHNIYIQVTPENYNELKKIFPIVHNSIIDFQNKLNVYFFRDKSLFENERYLLGKNLDLKIFCIVNLIKSGKTQILNKFFQDEKTDISIFGNLNNNHEKAILDYYLDTYKEVLIVRSKSLDKRIADGKDINPHFNFGNSDYNKNILNLLNSGKQIKYIEGKAGAGKSFLLINLAEKLNQINLENINHSQNKPYYPIYVNLSGIGIDIFNKEIKSKLEKIDNKEKYEIVFLIDSIDESNISLEQKIELDKRLLELSNIGKIVITSRSGHIYDYKENNKNQKELLDKNQEIIEMKDFEEEYIDEYLNKYFNNDENKFEQVKQILSKLNGVGNNPLLLCMVCEIVNEGKVKEKNINDITIIDIYSEIVELRILKWNESHEGRKIDLSDDDIYERLDLLAEIAFRVLLEGNNLSFNSIKSIGKLKGSEKSKKEYVESLNLLFRKNDNLEYDFVHKSFKEYFAGKYILEEIKKDIEKNTDNFNYEKFLCQSLKKVDFNFLDLLFKFIQIDEKVKERFLQKIDENISYFSPDIHNKIVYILGNLDEKKESEYLKCISINNDIIETILKYGGKKHIELAINFLDNGNIDYKLKDDILLFIIKNGSKEYFSFLINYLSNINLKFEKIKFLENIGENGGEIYLEFFVKIFNYIGTLIDIKFICIKYIVLFGGKGYVDFFNKIFDNENISENIKEAYLEYIIKYGGENYKDLIIKNTIKTIKNEKNYEFLEEHSEFTLNFLLNQIIEHQGENYIDFFLYIFNNEKNPKKIINSEKVLKTCFKYIIKYGGLKYIDFFIETYKDKNNNEEIKKMCFYYITQNCGEEYLDFIIEIFKDKDTLAEIRVGCLSYIVEKGGLLGEELIKSFIIQIFTKEDNPNNYLASLDKIILFENTIKYLGEGYLDFIISIFNNDYDFKIVSNNSNEIKLICLVFILENGGGKYLNIIKDFINKQSNYYKQFDNPLVDNKSKYVFKYGLIYLLKYGGNNYKDFCVEFFNNSKEDNLDYLEILEEYLGDDCIDLYIKLFEDDNNSENLRSKCLSYISKYGSYKYIDILFKNFYNIENSEWIRNLCLKLILEYSGKIIYESNLLELIKGHVLEVLKEIFNTEKYSGDIKSKVIDYMIQYLGIDYLDLFMNDYNNQNNSSWLKYAYLKYIFETGGDFYIDFAIKTFNTENDETHKKMCLEYIWSFGGLKYKDFFINQYNKETNINEKIKYLEYILQFGGDKSVNIDFAIKIFNTEENELIKETCLNYIWVLGGDKYIDFFIDIFLNTKSRKIKIECVDYFFGIGGKKAINFIKNLIIENKENDIKLLQGCLKILETIIGGQENIEFAEQYKYLLDN